MTRTHVSLAIALAVAAPAAAQQPAPFALRDLSFMTGCWASPNDAPERLLECFTFPYAGLMQGSSHTLKDKKTVSWEFAVFTEAEGKITYAPYFMGKALSPFTLTRLDGQSAVFENPSNDFPKKVIYRRNADRTLTARIEGERADDPQNQEWVMAPQDGQ
jgi:hypothetical protein